LKNFRLDSEKTLKAAWTLVRKFLSRYSIFLCSKDSVEECSLVAFLFLSFK
jgi:hypothetical protein